MPDEAFEVVGQVGHTDFSSGALDTDVTDEYGHARFLGGKDMLDGPARFGSGGVAPLAMKCCNQTAISCNLARY